jgi:hypothetical protein
MILNAAPNAFPLAMPRPTTSAVKPLLNNTAAKDWSRFQLFYQRSPAPPDCVESGLSPADLWMGIEQPQRLVYVTKLTLHRRIVGLFHPTAPLLLYGCGGLPSAAVCEHLHATQRYFRAPAFFLGDLDPGDLTVFLALTRGNPRLRVGRQGGSLKYLGVGDRFLDLFRRRLSMAQFKMSVLDMSPDEVHHYQLIRKMFLNIEEVIGSESLALLESGKKIEVEGLLRWALDESELRTEFTAFLGRG